MIKCAIGQDSHAFETPEEASGKPLILGGFRIDAFPRALKANSDGDVLLHALTNAVSGITGRNILGAAADELCRSGITDSREYLNLALRDLKKMHYTLSHVSFSVECKEPHLSAHVDAVKASVASCCGISPEQIGLTATSGEGLTACGQGLGISVLCIVTATRQAGAFPL